MYTVPTVFTAALPLLIAVSAWAQPSPLIFSGSKLPGGGGPGRGKQVVLIAGDQEYRSEESIPALAQILAGRHGCHCTVLFSVNRQTGKIDPNTIDNIPGLEALRRADLVVFFALVGTARKDLLESFRARETAMVDDLLFCRVFRPRQIG